MRFLFGDYTLDIGRRELTRGTELISAAPKVFDLLVYLVQNRERVVSKDDLVEVIWGGRIVSESTLTSHINAVRRAIGDSGAEQNLIRTIARKGFRFVGDVSDEQTSKHDITFVRTTESNSKDNTPSATAPTLPDRPSIAVLPFQNMSGDLEQEYFCDGIVEDIITALSRFSHLFVIARNSSFTYKGRSISIAQVGHELGVRYVLEGSVRKSGTRLRISSQLLEANSSSHLWAERFDGELEDIFELQDRVTERVVGSLVPRLEQAEIDRSKRKPTNSLDAYDYYLRALASLHRWTKEATSEALKFAYKAIDIDPEYGAALGLASRCYVWRKANAWTEDRPKDYKEAERLARRAAVCGKDDATALAWSGHTLAFVAHDVEEALALLNRALALNPNSSFALHMSGWVNIYLGDPELAIDHVSSAMRLSPLDPLLSGMQAAIAFAHYFAGRFDAAADWCGKTLRENPDYLPVYRLLAASLAMAGRLEEAQKAMAGFRSLDPKFRVADLKELIPLRRLSDLQAYEEGLRRAGMPE